MHLYHLAPRYQRTWSSLIHRRILVQGEKFMELGNHKAFRNLLIISQMDNTDTIYLLFARGHGELLRTTVNFFFGPPSPQARADQLQIFTLCLKDWLAIVE